MKIVVMKYGEALYSEKRIFSDVTTDGDIPMSFCFYLIQTQGKNILVDVGCDGEEHYKCYVFKHPVALVKEYGLEPEDITDIIITHSHYDHVDLIGCYPNALIHVQREEYEARCWKYPHKKENVRIFDVGYTVCEGVRVQKYGGHSIGSSIVYAGETLLVGDECYFQEHFDRVVRVGNSNYPERSQAFVKEFAPSYHKKLFFHDSKIMPKAVGFETVYETEE